ncbi:hypothetical protein CYMTET_8720 [Cymbomonas tetramitiformis]|uniref:Uncharacterized protein n=1 Tax=Cymbomonas tetramitiformis TaxID=36881 RepID=A0AAE0GSK8_9CHLO|nr:hypothetical protein CYMTET_8720 [Cymbomonas tetramitiformis]
MMDAGMPAMPAVDQSQLSVTNSVDAIDASFSQLDDWAQRGQPDSSLSALNLVTVNVVPTDGTGTVINSCCFSLERVGALTDVSSLVAELNELIPLSLPEIKDRSLPYRLDATIDSPVVHLGTIIKLDQPVVFVHVDACRVDRPKRGRPSKWKGVGRNVGPRAGQPVANGKRRSSNLGLTMDQLDLTTYCMKQHLELTPEGKNPRPLTYQPPAKMEAYIACCRKLQGLEDVPNDLIFVKRVGSKANKRRDYVKSKGKKAQESTGTQQSGSLSELLTDSEASSLVDHNILPVLTQPVAPITPTAGVHVQQQPVAPIPPIVVLPTQQQPAAPIPDH